MADSIPSQIRTVDPFSSYGSNVVNRHTKMVTFDEEGMANINSLRVTYANDATSTTVVVSTGFAYKDEVLLHMDGTAIVDFNTADHYYDWDSPGLGFNENGYYYIVLNYVYVKSRPAPVASYQILKPSQRGAFSTGGSWLFLAAILISGVGGAGAQIDNIFDYDPTDVDNKRLYVKTYTGTETELPDHNQTRDQSRVAYDPQADEFYFGYSDRWRSLGKGTGTVIKDTSGVAVGDLVYINGAGNVAEAILSAEVSSADGVVIVSDTETGSPPGTIQMIGLVEDVPIEAARVGSVAVGELLYLSGSESGKITDVKTTPIVQMVGRCLAVDGATVDMLFVRGDVVETNTAISVSTTLSAWTPDGGSYRADVDISEIGIQYNTVTVVDDADDMKIEPQDIEFVSTSITRIWMPDNTHTLHVTVVG